MQYRPFNVPFQLFCLSNRQISPAIGNPYTSLAGDKSIPMMSANFTVTMDKDGVFTGVVVGSGKYAKHIMLPIGVK